MKSNHLSKSIAIRRSKSPFDKDLLEPVSQTYLPLTSDNAHEIDQLNYLEVRTYQNLDAMPYAFEQDIDVLRWAAALLAESPTAGALLSHAQNNGWKLMLSDLGTGGFHLDMAAKILQIDDFSMKPNFLGKSIHYRTMFLMILIRALREIWHEYNLKILEYDFKAESFLMLERAKAADCDTVAIYAAWELRSAGYHDVWRYVLGSEEGDMAMILTGQLEQNPTSYYNGLALLHIFRQWYADKLRIDRCDHDTLNYIDKLLIDNRLSAGFGDRIIDAELIEKLSILPDGMAYLKDASLMVVQDPFFMALNDTINQAHLFQIVYDLDVVMVQGVPFTDRSLANKIFPNGDQNK